MEEEEFAWDKFSVAGKTESCSREITTLRARQLLAVEMIQAKKSKKNDSKSRKNLAIWPLAKVDD